MTGRVTRNNGPVHGGSIYGRDKPKSMRGSWGIIFRYLKDYWFVYLLAVGMILLETVLTSLAPEYLGSMTDIIDDGLHTGDIDIDAVTWNALVAFGLYAVATFAMYMRQYWMAGIAQNVSKRMRSDLQAKMDRLPMRFFDGCRKGDVMSRFTNDTDTVGTALGRALPIFTHGVMLFFVLIAIMLMMNVTLALVSMASAFLGMGVAAVVVRITQKYYRNQQRNIGSMYGLISELYTTHDVVLAYSASKKNKVRFDEINESLRVSGFRSEVTMGLLPAVMKFFGNIGYVAVCLVGAVMVIEGEITIGMVVAFILYVKLFSGPLDMIAHSLGSLQAAGAGAERISDFLSMVEM